MPVRFEPLVKFLVPIHPRPLAAISVAMAELDLSADRVRCLLDDGTLAGFDISPRPGRRACVRLLSASIDHCRKTGGKPFVMDWPVLFKLVWPYMRPNLRGIELARCLNCDRGHVENLILAGQVKAITAARPGPHGSPEITRASFEAFLKGRML